MINLIPPTARRSVIREYWLRVMSVWMFLIGTGCLIVAALLLPTYVQIWIQLNGLSELASASSDMVASYDISAQELIVASNQAKILNPPATSTPFSVYINNIETVSGSAVTLTAFTFVRPNIGETSISISGIARTRQDLANFRDSLSADTAYSRVELPISNLIKEKDLLFSMQLYLATSTSTL